MHRGMGGSMILYWEGQDHWKGQGHGGLEYGRVQGPVREHDSALEGAGKDSLTA